MGGIGKAVGNVIGSVTGANAAASATTSAANQSNAMAQQIYNDQVQRMTPYYNAGSTALTGLQNLVNNRSGTLADYYNSSEYSGLANQARYQQLASAEATGGLGSTATSNALASIAPQLGQQYLSSQYNNLTGLTGIGMNAANVMNTSGNNYANAYSNNVNQIGAAKVGNSLANGQALTQGIGFLAGLF
ncbi:DNA transfer protein [Erwinia tracheiphila]|uniref:DNA transfer protein n=1 Tax=Erwinia tracheiphila TaxID=65700 RepID=A0A345CT45_9GAMM|nr:DNA transfer protein [Erwinia tracheiphila]AXF76612.1 DNA transfer protein [Erwinia tracheiphila]UIA84716.1 DNA transfer protein [Erwinia tracheiphila]UIA93308.1 DNA transfer protein [Erwinia tracheiphila]